jgi:hypothetical protein
MSARRGSTGSSTTRTRTKGDRERGLSPSPDGRTEERRSSSPPRLGVEKRLSTPDSSQHGSIPGISTPSSQADGARDTQISHRLSSPSDLPRFTPTELRQDYKRRPMRWQKRGEDIVPLDTTYKGPPNDDMPIPNFSSWQDGDIWDDETGNVYDGSSGFLKFNYMREIGDDRLLDHQLSQEIGQLSNPDPSTFSSKKKMDSYRVKLNHLHGKIEQWRNGIKDPIERYEMGYDRVAERMHARVEVLKTFTLYPDAPLTPVTRGARAVMAQGYAAEQLYRDVTSARLTKQDPTKVNVINSTISDELIASMEVNVIEMTPDGNGLKWWASAAMGLRLAAQSADRSTLLNLRVGSGNVPIGLKPPHDGHSAGEFIVFGHDAPVVFDTAPEQNGLRTPSSADERHRVSYPAFIGHLEKVHSTRDGYPFMSDQEIATALLAMVKNPLQDPPSVLPADLSVLREFLTTWMVAETARHRSVIFNSVLMLQQIERGELSFERAIRDDGLHPMSGTGTAEAGRSVEKKEEDLLQGKDVGDPDKDSNVARRQAEQLAYLSPKNMSQPLEDVLREFTDNAVILRSLPSPS